MAELEEKNQEVAQCTEGEEENPNYKTPAPKALDEIVNQDADDESLRKYKETLLGGSLSGETIVDPNNTNKAIIVKLSLIVEDRDEVFIELTQPPEEIKKHCFTLKEGCNFHIKIYFYVQREIVTGLRYDHKVYRKGIQVDKMTHMMGSFGPQEYLQSFTTQADDAPSGLLMRGDYKIKSRFYDDDKNEYASWEWHLSVKKDW